MFIRRVVDESGPQRAVTLGIPVDVPELADRLALAYAEGKGYNAPEIRMYGATGLDADQIEYLPDALTTEKLHEVYRHAQVAAANNDVRNH